MGSAIPGGLRREKKMMQWPRCTPVPELKQDIVWNIPLLLCSWKPPRYGGRSDITFLKPNWSIGQRVYVYRANNKGLHCAVITPEEKNKTCLTIFSSFKWNWLQLLALDSHQLQNNLKREGYPLSLYTGWPRKNAMTLIVNFMNIVDET